MASRRWATVVLSDLRLQQSDRRLVRICNWILLGFGESMYPSWMRESLSASTNLVWRATTAAPKQMQERTHGVSRAQTSVPLYCEPQHRDQSGMSSPPKTETPNPPDYFDPLHLAPSRYVRSLGVSSVDCRWAFRGLRLVFD